MHFFGVHMIMFSTNKTVSIIFSTLREIISKYANNYSTTIKIFKYLLHNSQKKKTNGKFDTFIVKPDNNICKYNDEELERVPLSGLNQSCFTQCDNYDGDV